MARKRDIRRMLREPFETGGFKLLEWLVPLLPRCVVVGLSKLAGRVACVLPIREKRIGMVNIEAVFGNTRTPAEKRAILRSSFSTFCLTMLDLFWFARNPEKRIPRYVEFGPELAPFFEGRAHICITAHFGNWEIIGQAAALRGVEMASIAATVKNPGVDALLGRLRSKTGQSIIPQKGAMRTLIARLRKKGNVAFVLDQYTKPSRGGIFVDFLGFPMSVSAAPAALAYRTGTEIFFGFSRPLPGGKYLIHSPGSLQPPPFDKAADADQVALELTRQIQQTVSREILEDPGSWLWSYKHWRRVPGHTFPPGYPDY